jgi:hypothetical protein
MENIFVKARQNLLMHDLRYKIFLNKKETIHQIDTNIDHDTEHHVPYERVKIDGCALIQI